LLSGRTLSPSNAKTKKPPLNKEGFFYSDMVNDRIALLYLVEKIFIFFTSAKKETSFGMNHGTE